MVPKATRLYIHTACEKSLKIVDSRRQWQQIQHGSEFVDWSAAPNDFVISHRNTVILYTWIMDSGKMRRRRSSVNFNGTIHFLRENM